MKKYSEAEISELKTLMRTTKNVVLHKKYHAVLLHMEGYAQEKIAEILKKSRKSVGKYIRQYRDGGVEGLIPKKPPGRKPYLTKEQESQLYKTVSSKTPNDVGFDGLMHWTAKLACLWVLREFDVQYSVNGMLDMFHRLKLSYTRPTYVLAKADLKKQEQFRQDFELVKKNS